MEVATQALPLHQDKEVIQELDHRAERPKAHILPLALEAIPTPVEHQEDILPGVTPTLVEQEHHVQKLVLGAHHIQVELPAPHILEQKNKLLLCLICKVVNILYQLFTDSFF